MTLGLFFLALQQISHQTAVIYYDCAQGKGSLVCMKRNYSTGRSEIRVALCKAKDRGVGGMGRESTRYRAEHRWGEKVSISDAKLKWHVGIDWLGREWHAGDRCCVITLCWIWYFKIIYVALKDSPISPRFERGVKIIHSGSRFALSAFVYTCCASRGRIRGFSEGLLRVMSQTHSNTHIEGKKEWTITVSSFIRALFKNTGSRGGFFFSFPQK